MAHIEKIYMLYFHNGEQYKFSSEFEKRYNLLKTSKATEAFKLLKNNTVHVLIFSSENYKQSDIDFLIKVRKKFPITLRIILSNDIKANLLQEAINDVNIFKWFKKPYSEKDISLAVKEGHRIYKIRIEGKRLLDKLLSANEEFATAINQKLILTKLIISGYGNLN